MGLGLAELSPIPPTEIREAFKVFDRDGNGFISKQELGTAMRSLGYMPNEVELEVIIQRLDMDGRDPYGAGWDTRDTPQQSRAVLQGQSIPCPRPHHCHGIVREDLMMLEGSQDGDHTLPNLQTQWEWGANVHPAPALDPTPQAQPPPRPCPGPQHPVPVTPMLIRTLRSALIYRIPFFFFSLFKSLSAEAAKPRLPSLLILSASVTALELSTRPGRRMRLMAAPQWGPKGVRVTWSVLVLLGFPPSFGVPS